MSMRRFPAANRVRKTASSRSCAADARADYAKAEPVMAAYAKHAAGWARRARASSPRWSIRSASRGRAGAFRRFELCARRGPRSGAVVEVISKGAAQSWQMENRYKTMLADHFDHGFAVEWMRKDLAICLDEARRKGAVAAADGARRSVLRRSRERWAEGVGTRRACSRGPRRYASAVNERCGC